MPRVPPRHPEVVRLIVTERERLRQLVEVGIALGSELSLEALLRRVVETAAQLTGARYAALGVIDQSGTALEQFVTTGVDDETRARIGELPHGRGILGVLIREARPLRLRDLAEDPQSVGFPPGHPPMRTFLGVPVLLRGVAYGNLYLTEKDDGEEFSEADEELVTLLAAQAAVAIENARLYESSARWLRQFESLADLGDDLAGELEAGPMLTLVARRLRELTGARLVAVAVPSGDETGEHLVQAADGDGAEDAIGLRFRSGSKLGRVFERGRAERIDSTLEDPEIDQSNARRLRMHAALYVPLRVGDRAVGTLLAVDKSGPSPRFSDGDLRLAEIVAQRAAVAIELSRRVARTTLDRVLQAQEQERRRLARELHDETGQGLTSIMLALAALKNETEPQAVADGLSAVQELVVSTLQGVRELAFELRPKALDDFGLAAAVERLAQSFQERTGIAVSTAITIDGRLPEETESALYRLVQEGLTNVAKHARAHRVSIVLGDGGSSLVALVEDDGDGFAAHATSGDGFGLVAMRERIALLGGEVAIESTVGAGTTLRATIPSRLAS
jgi:two-component system, NarL family, sensor histidine kinase DevS